MIDGADEAVEEEPLLRRVELPQADLLGPAVGVPEDAAPDAGVGREPLERRPPERLLVVFPDASAAAAEAVPPGGGAGAGEDVVLRVPHAQAQAQAQARDSITETEIRHEDTERERL